MSHNELAAQIVRQARVIATEGDDARFVTVFCAMGIKNDTADFFRRDFAGVRRPGAGRSCSST